mgnify:CR=1 FL=1
MDPWFGGKRPNTLSVSAYFSKQTDISSNYLSNNSYGYNPYYGYGGYPYYGATVAMVMATGMVMSPKEVIRNVRNYKES